MSMIWLSEKMKDLTWPNEGNVIFIVKVSAIIY